MKLTLINPNTNVATTDTMVAIARGAAGSRAVVSGLTVRSGVPLIYDQEKLDIAADGVLALAPHIHGTDCQGVIVSAFGDPGLARLREELSIPVTGIAEAGMLEAAKDDRNFMVVTTTPSLVRSIESTAERHGLAARFRGVELTPGEPITVMADPTALFEAMRQACLRAVRKPGVNALVIGGGPLATAARALRPIIPLPIIEPIPAAVRLAICRSDEVRERGKQRCPDGA